jgi:cytochrome b subunit of formate dehydrogenase
MGTEGGTIGRHSLLVRIEHWLVAVSGLILVFTGFGQFPMYKRYLVTSIPGLGWSGDYYLNMGIHYWAAVVFTATVLFHLVYHGRRGETALLPRRGDLGESWRIMRAMFTGGEEPPSDKFLAEQRLAYAFFGGLMLLLIVTGLLKTWKNLPGNNLSPGLFVAVTMLHNLGTVLFLGALAAHVGALLVKPNRPLLPSIFTGRVDAGYARHRHSLWKEVKAMKETEKPVEQERDGKESVEKTEEVPVVCRLKLFS